jgi:hypothetical protein
MLKELIGQYSMVRTYSAGVFAGTIEDIDSTSGKIVRVKNARRIWKWEGAASLSELATRGTSNPSECKFPAEVPFVVLTEVIEILPISDKAKLTIENVDVWSE